MSVFVVFAKPPLRLRAAIFRAACQAKKVRGCSSVTEAMTLNSTVFFLLQFSQMNCCSNDPVQGKKNLNRTVKLNDKKEHRNVYSYFVEYLTLQSVNRAGQTKVKDINEVLQTLLKGAVCRFSTFMWYFHTYFYNSLTCKRETGTVANDTAHLTDLL